MESKLKLIFLTDQIFPMERISGLSIVMEIGQERYMKFYTHQILFFYKEKKISGKNYYNEIESQETCPTSDEVEKIC